MPQNFINSNITRQKKKLLWLLKIKYVIQKVKKQSNVD